MNEYELRTLFLAVATQLGHTDIYLLADLRYTVIDDMLVNSSRPWGRRFTPMCGSMPRPGFRG